MQREKDNMPILRKASEKASADVYGDKPYTVALYIRLSKEDDHETESQSVTHQRHLLRAFTEKQGLDVYDEYVDDGFSGGNFERPAFKRLLDDIENKKVNMLVTKDLSRLGRDYIQTGYYTEKYFPEKQVRYVSLLDGIDTGTDSAMNDITPFKAILNDLYAKDISKKIKSVKRDMQRQGLFIGGKAPYGYRLSPHQKNTLIPDEKASEIVKTIFRLALAGKSGRAIATLLNADNIPPPAVYARLTTSKKGPYTGLWSAERVNYTLRNQMYIGHMVQGVSQRVNYKSKKSIKMPKDEWVVVENTHPAIIEKEDFDRVQILLNSRKKTRDVTHDYFLKGLIYCNECGYPLGVIKRMLSGGKPVLYFVCRTYQRFTKARKCASHCVRVDTVTAAIAATVRAVCRKQIDADAFEKMAETFLRETQDNMRHETETQRLSRQLDRITANMDTLYTDRLNGLIAETDFQRLYQRLNAARAEGQKKLAAIAKLQSEQKTAVTPPLTPKTLTDRFIESTGHNRELYCRLIEKIALTADKAVHIHFRFNAQTEKQRLP